VICYVTLRYVSYGIVSFRLYYVRLHKFKLYYFEFVWISKGCVSLGVGIILQFFCEKETLKNSFFAMLDVGSPDSISLSCRAK
jgi:hypothetical protein